jgi:outer membrane protein assembly factor BamB
LTAIDPLTGDALWSRHDVPEGCELLGDEEVILAVPRDGTTALVVRATDGQLLGRCELPSKRDRLAVLGRRVATWSGGDERPVLRLLDPWQRREVWSREFPAGSKLARIAGEGPAEAAVLDPRGNFRVLSLADGAARVDARIEPVAGLLDVLVLRSPERYLLAARQSRPAIDKPEERIAYPLTLGGQGEIVSGALYAFDRATGALAWETKLDQRGLDVSQSPHWPILALGERFYFQGENGLRRYETRVTCLDKRDGRVLFEEKGPLSGGTLQIVPDAGAHSLDVRTGRSVTRLVFTGQPWPGR